MGLQARFVIVVVSVLWGCSSRSSSPSGSGSDGGASTIADGGAALDDGLSDAAAAADPATADTGPGSDSDRGSDTSLDGCGVKRAASSNGCADPCDARLTLPGGGGTFCTIMCAADADCLAPGAALLCPSTIGACVPRCTTDAACKAAGFLRCDAATGACDTI